MPPTPSAAAARRLAPQVRHPRLALYRRILRAHEDHLPAAQRSLGDAYVRAEFRAHRGASPRFLDQFDRQWRDYLTQLAIQRPDEAPGRPMTDAEIASLSEEQQVQLLKIVGAIEGPPNVPAGG